MTATEKEGPKILFLDVETFPLVVFTWGVYEQNALAVKEHSIICCYSAKWYRGGHTTKALPDYPGYKAGGDDKRLVADLWKLLDAADIVVAQNGDRFDIRKMNTRFIKHGMSPPSPYQTVDTLKVAKRVFGFDSNRLDDLCKYLGIGRKVSTGGFELWQGCMAGDKEAWRRMKRYNANDVTILEALYIRFLPWINNHPNHGTYLGGERCPKCGSPGLTSQGWRRNATTTYRRLQCRNCLGWCRSTKAAGRATITNA